MFQHMLLMLDLQLNNHDVGHKIKLYCHEEALPPPTMKTVLLSSLRTSGHISFTLRVARACDNNVTVISSYTYVDNTFLLALTIPKLPFSTSSTYQSNKRFEM